MKQHLVIFLSSLFWSYASTCVTPLGVSSTCISIYSCEPLLSAFYHLPVPNSVAQFLNQSRCGFIGNVPQVCCGPLPSQQNQPPRQISNENVATDAVFEEDTHPAPRNQCGIENNGDRIFGGEGTDLDEFPWMALIGYRSSTGAITYQCGGALVNRRYVLTAAHCITGAVFDAVGTPTMVRLGEYDLRTERDCKNGVCADLTQDIPILSTYPHAGYMDKVMNIRSRDDIGLIRLSRRANYKYSVQPICLVDKNEQLSTGTDVYVAGWGKTLSGHGSPVKLKLSLPIKDKLQCADKYKTVKVKLSDGQFCAGGNFLQDACRGDSGGPVMRSRPDGVWDAVGLVSFGNGCGLDGWPGVYTSVAKYSDWIHSTMRTTNV